MVDSTDELRRLLGAGTVNTPTTTDGFDYAASSFNPKTIKQNPYFLDDMRRYYEAHGITDKSDDELFDMLLDDNNVRQSNTFAPFIGARGSWADVASSSEEDQQRFARLKQVVEQYPSVFEEGGRSVMEAIPSVAQGIVTDPLNLVTGGLGAAAGGARALSAAARGAGRGRVITEGLRGGARSTALYETMIGGISGGIASAGDQATNVELDLQSETSLSKVAEDAVVSGLLSGTIGAFIGGVGGAVLGARASGVADGLRQLGYSDDQIVTMGLREGIATVRDGIPPAPVEAADGAADEIPDVDPKQNVADILAKQGVQDAQAEALRLNSSREAYRSLLTELTTELDQMVTDGVSERRIQAVRDQIASINEIIGFQSRMVEDRGRIAQLMASGDPKKIEQGRQLAVQYEDNLATLKSMAERPVPEDLRRYVDERIKLEDADPEGNASNAAASPTPTQQSGTEQVAEQVEKTPDQTEQVSPTQPTEQAPTPRQPTGTLEDLIPEEAAPPVEAPPAPAYKVRPQVRDYAAQNGVDLAEVTPTGKDQTITKADIKTYLASKGPTESYISAERVINEALEDIARTFDQDTLEAFRADPDFLAAYIINAKGVQDDKIASSVRDYINAHARANPEVKAEASPIEFTNSEKKRIRRLMKELKENNPVIPDLIARDAAERTIVRGREATAVGRVRSASWQKQTVPENSAAAKAPPPNKLQSFLRPSASFNRGTDEEYGIAGRFTNFGTERPTRLGTIPSAGALSYEEAVARATANKDAERPVAFIAQAPMGLADSSRPAQKGEVLWVDGRSTKVFRDWRNIYEKYYGHRPAEEPETISKQLTSLGQRDTRSTLKSNEDLIAAFKRGEFDAAELTKRLNENARARAARPATPVESRFEMPPLVNDRGEMAAFIRKASTNGKSSVRKVRQADIDGGLTAQDIIGAKSKIEDWHVVYLPPEAPDTQAATMVAAMTKTPARLETRKMLRGALDYDAYERKELRAADLSDTDWRAIEVAASLQKAPDAVLKLFNERRARGLGITGKLLNRLINNIEGGQLRPFNRDNQATPNWPSTDAARQRMVKLLAQLYDMQARMAPDGVALPEADRVNALEDISTIFKSFGPEQLRLARNTIDQLNSAARPAFLKSASGVAETEAVSRSGDRVGSISFGPDFKKKHEIPQIAALFHEIAHWGYMNILTPTERLRFWDTLGKYYDANGSFMPAEIAKRSPVAKVNGTVYGPQNAINSPAEFFANQFSMRMMQQIDLPDPEGLWARITRFIKAIFDRFYSRASIDADLEPFFARLLADPDRKAAEIVAFTDDSALGTLDDLLPDEAVVAPAAKTSTPKPTKKERPVSTREGPAENYLDGDFETVMARAHPDREALVKALYFNEGELTSLQNKWAEAEHLDDASIAIEAARDTIRYLAGSAFTREQARKYAAAAAARNGTPLQEIRTKNVFGPYQKAGKLATNMRSKVYDMQAILNGREVVGVDLDDDSFDKAFPKIASVGFAEGGFSVSGDQTEVGRRLLQLYRYGKKLPDGNFRKGSSLQDVFNLAHKALNTDFERTATRPRSGPNQGNARISGSGYTTVKIGKFENVRIGDTFTELKDKKRTEVFTVTDFIERDDGFRVARMRLPDGGYAELAPDNAAMFRRGGARGADELAVAEQVRADTNKLVDEAKAADAAVVEQAVKAASGRTVPSDKAPAPVAQPAVRAMTEAALNQVIVKEADTVVADRAADELLSIRNARVTIPTKRKPKSVPEDMSELAESVEESFRYGDEDADQWAAALFEANGGQPVITFQDPAVATAIAREVDESAGALRDVGVPAQVNSHTREILLGIEHRKHRETFNARTLAYRLLNLADRKEVTRSDVAHWLGHKIDAADAFNGDEFFGYTTDPLFKSFRDTMRRVGNALNGDTADGDNIGKAVDSLVSMLRRMDDRGDDVIGVLPDIPASLSVDAAADHWVQLAVRHRLSNGMGGRTLPPPPMPKGVAPQDTMAANELVSRILDRMAYVTNGMIADGPARDMLYRLTWYGDPFGRKAPPSTFVPKSGAMTLTEARFALDDLSNPTPGRAAALTSFIGRDYSPAEHLRFYHLPAKSDDGTITPTHRDDYGAGVYLLRAPENGVGRLRTKGLIDKIADPDARARVRTLANELAVLTDEINALVMRDASNRIPAYIAREKALIEELKEFEEITKAMPVIVAPKAPLNMSTSVNPDHARLLRMVFTHAAEKLSGPQSDLLSNLNAGFAKFDRLLATNGLGTAPMKQLIETLRQEAALGITDINKVIRAAGYDSITTASHTIALDPAILRPANDPTFDIVDMPAAGARISPAGAMLTRLVDSDVESIPTEKMPLILGPVSKAEPYRPITNMMGNMMKRRRPTPEDRDAVIRFGHQNAMMSMFAYAKGTLRSNSNTLRELGMHWMANHMENIFPSVTQTTAKMLYGTATRLGPLRALQSLPDAGGIMKHHLRAWFRRSSADALGSRKFGADQPDSHKRILAALRLNTPRHWKALSPQERSVAETIRSTFRDAHEQLTAAGVAVGDRGPDYFPQVWDSAKIRKDKEGFIADMAAYLRAEAVRHGRSVDPKELNKTAARMYNSMSESETEGLFREAMGHSRKSAAENLDYSRLLDLKSVPEGDALRKYLEGDLEAILVKYYDAAARRLRQVETFGNSNHAAYDYFKVVNKGREGIAYLLSHNRVEKTRASVVTQDGVEDIEFADSVVMPFQGNEYQAHEFTGRLMEVHEKLGNVAAREMLMQAAPIDRATGMPSSVYMRRVEAIVAALDDYGGEAQEMTMDVNRFLEDLLLATNRKPLGSSRAARKVSTAVRNFNSVSLLGFTLLSSLGDAVLPLIRSGHMKAYLGALKKMASDPEYRRVLNNVGAAMESTIQDRMTHLWGSGASKGTNAFFSAIGLTPWTDVMRSTSAAVGYETFVALQQKALKNYTPNKPLDAQSRIFKQAYRMLKQYGIESYATNTAHSLADRSLLDTDDLLRTAVIRFADDTIFAPNPNDIPLWAQRPLGAVAFQLKSFPTMMMRLANEVLLNDVRIAIRDALGKPIPDKLKGTGDLRRGAYLLTLAPLFGAGALTIKDVVQGRGSDESDRPTFSVRERRFSTGFLGMEDEWDDETMDAFAGWYIEGLTQAGGFGLLLEMIHDVLGQADNGAYGQVRVASTIFGPSVGIGTGAFNIGAGLIEAGSDILLDSEPTTNSKERLAAREFAQRIPVLGGVRPFREALTDSLAGEQEKRNTQRAAKNQPPDLPDYSKLF